ncbi:MAG TPA: YggT family protein [Syntrophomonadaceae bacterium]|nr:YggT family protein [Syntrophomonadaceae bacterium]
MAINFIVDLVNIAFNVVVWLVIGRCMLSFIKHDPTQPIIKFIYDLTEPIMSPFRKLMPPRGGLDFSPIITVLALVIIQNIVMNILYAIF